MARNALQHHIIRPVQLVTRTLRLVWHAGKGYSFALAILLCVEGTLPAVLVWLSKNMIDTTLNVVNSRGNIPAATAITTVVVYVVVSLITHALAPVRTMIQAVLNERTTANIATALMAKAERILGISYYEDPRFFDELRMIQTESSWRPATLLTGISNVARSSLSTISLLVLLTRFHPLLPALFLVFGIPQAIVLFSLQRRVFEAVSWRTPEGRKMQYVQSLPLSEHFAREMRAFNAIPHFIERYWAIFWPVHRGMHQLRVRQTAWSVAMAAMSVTVTGAALIWVVSQTVAGKFTAGDLAVYVQAGVASSQALSQVMIAGAGIYESLLFLDRMYSFFDLKPNLKLPEPGSERTLPAAGNVAIEFRDVRFGYPGARETLHGISFSIKPGETVALVGPNGGGKSTIVKLLGRFYDPTSGQVLINGSDFADYDPMVWRSHCAFMFQDFCRYQMTVRENISLGCSAGSYDEQKLTRAVSMAGGDQLVARLQGGLDQQLGRQFEGGVDLSGGEWQRIALARACFQDSRLLVLDEPTSALDPLAEHEFHERLHSLTQGKTALIVSHRLATVKMVHRIMVVDNGRIVEEGSHDELLAAHGVYANLY